jgi:WASH complex subunit strumpellin
LLAAYGFFNLETRKPVLNLKTLYVLAKCIGISGMQGLDYLLSMRIMDKLKGIIKVVTKVCDQEKTKTILQAAYSSLKNIGSFSERYERILSDLKREFKNLSDFLLNELTEVGQYILLRDMICLQLRMLGKIGSPRLQLVLSDLNESLLSDMVRNQFVA